MYVSMLCMCRSYNSSPTWIKRPMPNSRMFSATLAMARGGGTRGGFYLVRVDSPSAPRRRVSMMDFSHVKK